MNETCLITNLIVNFHSNSHVIHMSISQVDPEKTPDGHTSLVQVVVLEPGEAAFQELLLHVARNPERRHVGRWLDGWMPGISAGKPWGNAVKPGEDAVKPRENGVKP